MQHKQGILVATRRSAVRACSRTVLRLCIESPTCSIRLHDFLPVTVSPAWIELNVSIESFMRYPVRLDDAVMSALTASRTKKCVNAFKWASRWSRYSYNQLMTAAVPPSCEHRIHAQVHNPQKMTSTWTDNSIRMQLWERARAVWRGQRVSKLSTSLLLFPNQHTPWRWNRLHALFTCSHDWVMTDSVTRIEKLTS